MIKKYLKQKHMLVQLVISVFMLLCLPLMLINWYSAVQSYYAFKQQNYDIQAENIEYISEYFYTQYEKMMMCTRKAVSAINTFTGTYESLASAKNAMNKAELFQLQVPMSSECWVAIPEEEYVVGADYCLRTSLFGEHFSSDEVFCQQISDILSSEDEEVRFIPVPHVKKGESGGMLIVFNGKVRNLRGAKVLWHISQQTLVEDIFGKLTSNDYDIYIANQNGTILCYSSDINRGGVTEFLFDSAKTTDDIDVDGQTRTFYKKYNSKLGLWFAISTPQLESNVYVRELYNKIGVTVAISMVSAGIMCALLVWINYKPIYKLVKKVSQTAQVETDEISLLSAVVDENIWKDAELNERKRQITKHVISKLLTDGKILREELEQIGIPLSFNSFFVMCGGKSLGNSEIANMLREKYNCLLYTTEDERYCIYVCAAEMLTNEVIWQIAEDVHSSIGGELGIGTLEQGEKRVKYSYYSALSAVEHCRQGEFVCYKEDDAYSTIENYPASQMADFLICLKNGDAAGAEDCFLKVLEYLDESSRSILMRKYQWYNIVSSFSRSVSEMGISMTQLQLQELLGADMQQASNIMRKFVENICNEMEIRRCKNANKTVREIQEYVEMEYGNINLNQHMIADRFNMPVSAFGVFFNNTFGMPFRQYLQEVRIEKARKMLEESEMNVKDICSAVGMPDPSYFTKLFKKATGLTPTQYQEKMNILR